MNEIIFEILKVVIMVAVIVVARYVVPWLKQAVDGEKLNTVTTWVQEAVLYAQQVFSAESGAERKAIVVDFLKNLLEEKNISITEDQLNVLIESAVKAMKISEATPTITVEKEEGSE